MHIIHFPFFVIVLTSMWNQGQYLKQQLALLIILILFRSLFNFVRPISFYTPIYKATSIKSLQALQMIKFPVILILILRAFETLFPAKVTCCLHVICSLDSQCEKYLPLAFKSKLPPVSDSWQSLQFNYFLIAEWHILLTMFSLNT